MLKHNYKNMEIWKQAVDIADHTEYIVNQFPDKERFGLSSQMSRSSVSISSNIAEGSSRSNRSFVHFLSISLGSSFELETQLIISRRRGYVEKIEFTKLMQELDHFQKMTTGFQRYLLQKI